jgi:hypothetical protein
LAVTAVFFGGSTAALTPSALPFGRAGDGVAFFAGFLVLDVAIVIISVGETVKRVYIVCPVFPAMR